MTEVARTGTHHAAPAVASGDGERTVKHYHHGRTPAAWTGAVICFVGIVVGGIGFMFIPVNWVLFWIGAGLIILGGLATVAVRALGYGAD